MVAKYILSGFPPVQEINVTITKLQDSTDREVSGVSAEATFDR
jgi:hypothetical protein